MENVMTYEGVKDVFDNNGAVIADMLAVYNHIAERIKNQSDPELDTYAHIVVENAISMAGRLMEEPDLRFDSDDVEDIDGYIDMMHMLTQNIMLASMALMFKDEFKNAHPELFETK